jgi:phasin family protein
MFQTPEQFVNLQKTAFETVQAIAQHSIATFEKLAELNVQAVKTTLSESSEQVKNAIAIKDPKAFVELAASQTQPTAEKVSAYTKHVYEIASEYGTEIAKLFEKQVAESNKQVNNVVELMSKNAPAGSEGLVTFIKTAVTAANGAYEQVNKATKQVVDMAESNFAAVNKSVPKARKAA